MLLQQIEQLPGHNRAEGFDGPATNHDPFVVGTGMADERVGIDQPARDRTQHLHFLPTHDIGAPIADVGNARHDRFAFACPNQAFDERVDASGTRNVRRFYPPAVRSDHAGEEQRQVTEPLAYLGGRVGEGTGLD